VCQQKFGMLLVVSSVLAGLAFVASPVAAATFGELEAWCAPADSGGRPALCSGYLETQLQGLASADPALNDGTRACVPEAEDRSRVIRLMRAYAREKPSSRTLPGIVGLGQALKDRYPCR
jgi:hypothetical protein